MNTKREAVAIVGAGLAGLAAAHTLKSLGHECTLFDKGRGPGGRLSSRRTETLSFDHGAQYFTARDPLFRGELVDWLAQGVVERWDGRIVRLEGGEVRDSESETERYVGVPRMSSLARHLAQDVALQSKTRVSALAHGEAGWSLHGEQDAELGTYARLIVTAPPPQAADLVGTSSPLGERARSIRMQPCWAVMLAPGVRLDVEFDGAFCASSALSWVARNSNKPGRAADEAWVLHASAEWTDAHLDDSPEDVTRSLLDEFSRLTGLTLPEPVHASAHLWRFAQPDSEVRDGHLLDRERRLALAGDGYCGGRVEGAYLSGVSAAHAIVGA